MSQPKAPTRSCRGCARAWRTRSRPPTSTPASRSAPRSTVQLDAARRQGRRRRHRRRHGRPRRRAVRPRRHRRHRSARDRPHRAARLDHELRAELPRRHRVLRRGLPVALHAGGAGLAGPRCGRGSRSSCWRRASSRRRERRGQAAAVRRRRRPRRLPAGRRAVGVGARARQPHASPRSDAEFVSTDMGAVLPRLQAVLDENPDLAYSRIVCPRKLAENRPTTRSSSRRSRAGGRPALGTRPRARRRDDVGVGPLRAAGAPSFPYYHRWYFRTGAQGDFETLVRLLEPEAGRHARRHARHRRAGPGLERARHRQTGPATACSSSAARCSRRANSRPSRRDEYEHWDDPFPRPLQT